VTFDDDSPYIILKAIALAILGLIAIGYML